MQSLRLYFIVFTFLMLNQFSQAQTVHPSYWDGQVYVKIKETSNKVFPDFDRSKTTKTAVDACISANSTYDNLNGGANCDNGIVEAPWEVWNGEAYLVEGCQPGQEYIFSICEGYDSETWEAELTAIERTPEITLGAIFGNVIGCELVFIIPNSYNSPVDILLIVADHNNCGGLTEEIDNGIPRFGCLCPIPTGLGVSNVQNNEALLVWSEVNEANTYNVQIRQKGTTEWTENIGIEDTDALYTELSACMEYEFRVQSVCEGENQSEYSSIFSFKTEGCDASSPIVLNPVADVTLEEDFGTYTVGNANTIFNGTELALDYHVTSDNPDVQVVINGNEDITLTATSNYYGTANIVLQATDDNNVGVIDAFSVTIHPVNDHPIANNDVAATQQNTPVTIAVLNNDSDIDGDNLSIVNFAQATNGTVTQSGNELTYTPNTGFDGSDQFTYVITDGNNGAALGLVNISVSNVNAAPLAQNDVVSTNEDQSLSITPLENDSDPDGNTVSISSFTQPSNGTIVQNANVLTYTPNENFYGTDAFSYTISDGELTDMANVDITVNPVNDPPIAAQLQSPENGTTLEEWVLDFNWIASTDIECETDVRYSLTISAPDGMSFTVNDLEETTFMFTDLESLALSTTYSWVVVTTDCEGASTTSETFTFTTPDFAVSIEENTVLANSLKLYPNPNNGTFQLSADLDRFQKLQIRISDMFGREIDKRQLEANRIEETIDLPNITSGMYLLSVKTENETQTLPFVVR